VVRERSDESLPVQVCFDFGLLPENVSMAWCQHVTPATCVKNMQTLLKPWQQVAIARLADGPYSGLQESLASASVLGSSGTWQTIFFTTSLTGKTLALHA